MPAFDIAALIDGSIVLTLVEAAVLVLHHRRTGRGPAPREFGASLLSGLSLMAALDGCARGAGASWIALCLLAAGVFHAADLTRRRHSGPATALAARRPAPTHGSRLA